MRRDIGRPVPLADGGTAVSWIGQEFLPTGAARAERIVEQRGDLGKIGVFFALLDGKGCIRVNGAVIPLQIQPAADEDFGQRTVGLQQRGKRLGQLADVK